MTEVKKKITAKEFRELGLLQEVNRFLLHPMGLALETMHHDDGTVTFGDVWDYRDDPEGLEFHESCITDQWHANAKSVRELYEAKRAAREEGLGHHIQPEYPDKMTALPGAETLGVERVMQSGSEWREIDRLKAMIYGVRQYAQATAGSIAGDCTYDAIIDIIGEKGVDDVEPTLTYEPGLGDNLRVMADELETAARSGADLDEPEGSRWVSVSDTLLKKIVGMLRSAGG